MKVLESSAFLQAALFQLLQWAATFSCLSGALRALQDPVDLVLIDTSNIAEKEIQQQPLPLREGVNPDTVLSFAIFFLIIEKKSHFHFLFWQLVH